MKSKLPLARFGLLLAAALPLTAQTAPPPALATLAKYDKNRNGVLDPEELAAKDADERRAAGAVSAAPGARAAAAGDEVVALSPFEVVADNKGYFQSNTMSGTRLNSKIEDLGQSITVIARGSGKARISSRVASVEPLS